MSRAAARVTAARAAAASIDEQISGDVLYAGLPRARVPPSAVACVARARQASRVRTRAYALSV